MKNKGYAFSIWIKILRSVEDYVIHLSPCWLVRLWYRQSFLHWLYVESTCTIDLRIKCILSAYLGNDLCDEFSVADCPSWIYRPLPELPSLRCRRQLPWLGVAWHRALTQRAVCPLMLWSRLSESLSTLRVVLYHWGCVNPVHKRILSNRVGLFAEKGWPMLASNLQLVYHLTNNITWNYNICCKIPLHCAMFD